MKIFKLEVCDVKSLCYVSWKFASPHTHVLKIYVMKVCKLEGYFTSHTCFESLCYESWKFASPHTFCMKFAS